VPVAEPVLAALSKPMIDHRGPEFAQLLGRIAQRLQPIFGTTSDIVLLGSSGTGGLEAALVSTFSSGDRLLACPVGVFGRRFIAIARQYGCEVEVLDTPLGCALDPEALAARLVQDRERSIKGILLTHNETSTGVENDMSAIARAIGAHGALTLVDSVSGMGGGEFKMDEWGFDIVVSASQKVFAAPPGVAMVAISGRAWHAIEGAKIPSFYFSLKKAREFAALGQTPWTPPISILFALDAALERYCSQGAQNIWHRHGLYARAIRSAFEALGMKLFSAPGAHSNTVVAAYVPSGLDAAKLLKTMREDRGVVLSGGQLELKGKIIRMGTMGEISQTDILGALGCLEIVLLESDVPLSIGCAVRAALQVFLTDATLGGEQSMDGRTAARTMVGSS
ncbi:MAG: alanine--glyoxylate aminotransferase family protein, partial [Candidatus Eremiobacteraeota bacterium]|nr:alanine--glyoxylate aminotransferase family protein [Candidatus Eremiobacteraeota bacterium]